MHILCNDRSYRETVVANRKYSQLWKQRTQIEMDETNKFYGGIPLNKSSLC